MRSKARLAAVALAATLVTSGARADDPMPAPGFNAAKQAQPGADPAAAPPASGSFPVHTWELPAIDVPGVPRPSLVEEELVGDYKQPRWSAQRRFPTTRMYVIPKGKIDFEWWLRYTAPFKALGSGRELRSYYEFEFGLGHRLQFDVYLVVQQEGTGDIKIKREQAELRWAVADWGKIWGNPTLYLEWQHRNGEGDRLEGKILLGGA